MILRRMIFYLYMFFKDSSYCSFVLSQPRVNVLMRDSQRYLRSSCSPAEERSNQEAAVVWKRERRASVALVGLGDRLRMNELWRGWVDLPQGLERALDMIDVWNGVYLTFYYYLQALMDQLVQINRRGNIKAFCKKSHALSLSFPHRTGLRLDMAHLMCLDGFNSVLQLLIHFLLDLPAQTVENQQILIGRVFVPGLNGHQILVHPLQVVHDVLDVFMDLLLQDLEHHCVGNVVLLTLSLRGDGASLQFGGILEEGGGWDGGRESFGGGIGWGGWSLFAGMLGSGLDHVQIVPELHFAVALAVIPH